jgi:hypothetical protein
MSCVRYLLVALLVLLPMTVSAATLYLEPSAETFGVGDTFIMNVRLDTGGECVNAVRAVVTYPDTLKAVDFSRGSSILSLWVEEPRIDSALHSVIFSGGIPGGYCGRIPGDAVVTNIVGKIVFTVKSADEKEARIVVDAAASQVLLNDGAGTLAPLETTSARIGLSETRTTTSNPWLEHVREDATPPEEFTIIVESTNGVFGGRYFIVFSTLDKQSGIDHFEIYERGAWKTITSPYQLKDQTARSIQVKAIDKAGNERMGTYIEGSAPPRVRPAYGVFSVAGLLIVLLILVIMKRHMDRREQTHDALS